MKEGVPSCRKISVIRFQFITEEAFIVNSHGSEKLKNLASVLHSSIRQRNFDASLNAVEKLAFPSESSLLSTLGTTGSRSSSAAASHLQQSFPDI